MNIRLKNRPSDIVFVVRNDEGKSTSQIMLHLSPPPSPFFSLVYIVYVSNLLIAIYTAKSTKERKRREKVQQVEAAEGILNMRTLAKETSSFYDTVGYNRCARNELIFNCMYSEMRRFSCAFLKCPDKKFKFNLSLNQSWFKAWKSDDKNL